MDSFVSENDGVDGSYKAPDPDFISAISLFSSSLPWDRFKKFFKSGKLLDLSGDEQLILLRFIAVQELLCLNDADLLRWLKNQFYLFSFLQPGYKPRLPTLELLKRFRTELDNVGLLEPFRKHCQHIIQEHAQRFPAINKNPELKPNQDADKNKTYSEGRIRPDKDENHIDFNQSLISKTRDFIRDFSSSQTNKIEQFDIQGIKNGCCENCGSSDFVKLKTSQKESSLPAIRFIRCRMCGNTYRM